MPVDTTGTSRREVLRQTGSSLAIVGGTALATGSASAIPQLTVTTQNATNVCSCSATLNGTLEHLGHNDFIHVFFEWGEKGTGLPNTTSGSGRSTTGSFSEDITDLACTTYEFRAVGNSEDLDHDKGSIVEFTVTA